MFNALEDRLAAAGNSNPKRSMEELAAHVLGCRPLEIYFREISPKQVTELETLIARAEAGEPIQYIIGHVDFRGLEIACDPRALIPRPETELLVEEVLSHCRRGFQPRLVEPSVSKNPTRLEASSTLAIADVCTGTGCIGLALANELPNAKVSAIDIAPEALSLARENAERLGLSERLQTLESDLLSCFLGRDASPRRPRTAGTAVPTEIKFDIIVSNPPYIFSNVWKKLEPCVRDHEPQLALDGGEDGMDLIRPLVKQVASVLKSSGSLFLEIGYNQGQAVFQCLEKAGFKNIRIIKDLAGHDRIVAGFKG